MRHRLPGILLAGAIMSCGGSTATDPPPVSTYAGSPAEYPGDAVLLVVTWADWASVWPATRDAVAEYRASRPDVDVRYVNADDEGALVRELARDVVPSVVVMRAGHVVASKGNVANAAEVVALVAQAEGAP
jgi:hypothetical protein